MSARQFDIIDGETLMTMQLPPIRFIAAGLLPQGLHILAGAPKVGKSLLALWLCLKVSRGEPIWDFPVTRGGVLYLCLEDSLQRIQNRLYDITDDVLDNLYFPKRVSDKLGRGLEEQLVDHMTKYPDTALIVIDTLQAIRGPTNDINPYASDYRDITALKLLADKYGIAILLIHHLRKMSDDDPMNMISGTTGISGAADSSFVLIKDKRGGKDATLYCTGRDIEYRELRLTFDSETHIWNLISDSVTSKPEPSDGIIFLLTAFLKEHITFSGTATELSSELEKHSGETLLPNVLMKKIMRHKQELLEYGVSFTSSRTRDRRELKMYYSGDGNDENDGKTDIIPVSDFLSQLSQPSQSVITEVLATNLQVDPPVDITAG